MTRVKTSMEVLRILLFLSVEFRPNISAHSSVAFNEWDNIEPPKGFNIPESQPIPYSSGGARVTFTNVSIKHKITSGLVTVGLKVDETVYLSSRIILALPVHQLEVGEDWNRKVLTLSWDPEYFNQFYPPGEPILLDLIIHESKDATTNFMQRNLDTMLYNTGGVTQLSLTSYSLGIMQSMKFPYYYVLRLSNTHNPPIGNISEMYLSSRLFTPTYQISQNDAGNICSKWLSTTTTPVVEEAAPCPNTLAAAKLDKNFIEAEHDPQIFTLTHGRLANQKLYYERVPTRSGHAQTCSYNKQSGAIVTNNSENAGWMHRVSRDISYPQNYLSDIWPYIVCCLQTNQTEMCDSFHQKRPINSGHGYAGANEPSQGIEDPHIITFDGVRYDYMGNGEYWLIHGTEVEASNFAVQGRMAPISTKGLKASWFTAVAIREGNTTVQVQIEKNTTNLLIIINQAVLLTPPKSPSKISLPDVSIFIDLPVVKVTVLSGFTIKIVHKSNYLNVYGFAAQGNKGKGYKGLFGSYDGNMDNDLTSKEGEIIPSTSNNLANLSLISTSFGSSWKTSHTNSLFLYEFGLDWFPYSWGTNFRPLWEYPDPATMPENVRKICKEIRACYYEYVAMENDLKAAEEVAKSEQEYERLKVEVGLTIPTCDHVGENENAPVSVEAYVNGSLVTYKCRSKHDLPNGHLSRACYDLGKPMVWDGAELICILLPAEPTNVQSR